MQFGMESIVELPADRSLWRLARLEPEQDGRFMRIIEGRYTNEMVSNANTCL